MYTSVASQALVLQGFCEALSSGISQRQGRRMHVLIALRRVIAKLLLFRQLLLPLLALKCPPGSRDRQGVTLPRIQLEFASGVGNIKVAHGELTDSIRGTEGCIFGALHGKFLRVVTECRTVRADY